MNCRVNVIFTPISNTHICKLPNARKPHIHGASAPQYMICIYIYGDLYIHCAATVPVSEQYRCHDKLTLNMTLVFDIITVIRAGVILCGVPGHTDPPAAELDAASIHGLLQISL